MQEVDLEAQYRKQEAQVHWGAAAGIHTSERGHDDTVDRIRELSIQEHEAEAKGWQSIEEKEGETGRKG